MALVAAVLAAVHHAEVVALRVGEPFGAILLALAVTVIELGLIVSIMLGDQPEPTLVRDTIHAVVVLVLHGIAGLCIVVGALRHREQEFRVQGAQAYLIVLLPMVAITLVLPNFTTSAPGPYYTNVQLAFVSVACLLLWLAFTFVQTVRHREHFLPNQPGAAAPAARPSARLTAASLGLLLVALVAVVLLAKGVSPFIQAAVAGLGAPPALVGVIVAAIVLLPEGMTAVRAARDDQLQTSINLALGSGRGQHRPDGAHGVRRRLVDRQPDGAGRLARRRGAAGAVVHDGADHLRHRPRQPAVGRGPPDPAGDLAVPDHRAVKCRGRSRPQNREPYLICSSSPPFGR